MIRWARILRYTYYWDKLCVFNRNPCVHAGHRWRTSCPSSTGPAWRAGPSRSSFSPLAWPPSASTRPSSIWSAGLFLFYRVNTIERARKLQIKWHVMDVNRFITLQGASAKTWCYIKMLIEQIWYLERGHLLILQWQLSLDQNKVKKRKHLKMNYFLLNLL